MKKEKMRPAMKEVTVIIPNYNGIRFIEDCLNALQQQEASVEFEILVVDNGSEDGSRELIETQFPEVTLISLSSNTGFCHAVNVGIQAAATPYVLLLNNDTKAASGFVENLYRAIAAKPEAFSVSAKMLMWDRKDLLDDAGDRYCVLGWAYARGKGRPADGFEKPAEVFSACGGAAIYRKSVLEKIGLFDEAHFAYLEDLDIGYRARIHGYRNYYEPSAEVIHYGSASSGSRYNEWKTEQAASNSVYVIAKNMPLFQWIWNLPFLFFGYFVKFLFFCGKGMGITYLKGVAKGLKQSVSKSGKTKKIPFRWRRFPAYLAIQGQLYLNLIRLLKKT